MTIINSAIQLAENEYATGFRFKEAYVEFVVASEGFLHLTALTKDDAGFQTFAKQRFEYTFGRAQFCKSKIQKDMKPNFALNNSRQI